MNKKKSSAEAKEARKSADHTLQLETVIKTDKKIYSNSRIRVLVYMLVVATTLATNASLYYLVKKEVVNRSKANDALISQISTLQKTQQAQQSEFNNITMQYTSMLSETSARQNELTRQFHYIRQKIATFAGSDAKTWLLAQVRFLVKLAERKLWSDQDLTTVVELLKSADADLADINNPIFITARRAIANDITDIITKLRTDYDSIILKLNYLSTQIDNLRIPNNNNHSPIIPNKSKLSNSISDWYLNLQKSWQNFINNFIVISRQDKMNIPLLAPDKNFYLQENIRLCLLIATQAVQRHQEEIYRQVLKNASMWVRCYFNNRDSATTSFLSEIDWLQKQNIAIKIPNKLKCQPMIEKLMKTSAHNVWS